MDNSFEKAYDLSETCRWHVYCMQMYKKNPSDLNEKVDPAGPFSLK